MSCGRALSSRDIAAVCATCLMGERDNKITVGCTIEGRGIKDYVQGGRPCPLGKHSAKSPIVRWLGMAWMGVPMPIRLWLMVVHTRHPRPDSFTSCGCNLRLKTLWDKLRSKGVAHAR